MSKNRGNIWNLKQSWVAFNHWISMPYLLYDAQIKIRSGWSWPMAHGWYHQTRTYGRSKKLRSIHKHHCWNLSRSLYHHRFYLNLSSAIIIYLKIWKIASQFNPITKGRLKDWEVVNTRTASFMSGSVCIIVVDGNDIGVVDGIEVSDFILEFGMCVMCGVHSTKVSANNLLFIWYIQYNMYVKWWNFSKW